MLESAATGPAAGRIEPGGMPLRPGLLRFLFRDSIALRISLAVFGGLMLTQLIGFLLITGERLHVFPPINATAVEAIIDRALAAVPAAPAAGHLVRLDVPGIDATLSTEFSPVGEIFDPPPFHAFRGELQKHARGRYDLVLVEAPFPPPEGRRAAFRIWLRLADHRWLALSVPGDLLQPPYLLRLLLWCGLSLLGAVPLSLFVARRLTAPIRRFSAAAERLGLELTASPLPESGPAELRAAAATINAMQGRIKRFVDDRTEMLAAISHDLRTPISRLRLRTEALAEGADRQRMLADLALMDQMIGATLDFARDAGAAEARCRIDLASLVESLCQELGDLGHDAVYRGPAYLEFTCRPLAIGRALRNLLENAVQYGDGAAADIIDRPDGVEITIADRGPGIPVEEQQRVFEPFTRLDRARSSAREGVGLGLAIARNIARAHGGDVTLRNGDSDGRGSGGLVATLRLPRR